MKDKLNISNHLTDQPCPSRKSLVAFWEGRLPEDELQVILEHLEQCDFCRAASEGYAERKLHTPIAAMLSEIDAEVDQKATERKREGGLKGMPLYGLAAILLVLVV